MARLTLRAYARHRGCSVATVQYAIRKGRIKRGRDGLIDAEAADRTWPARTDSARSQAGRKAADTRKAEAREHEPDHVADTFASARAARETFAARLKELEFLRASQELVPVADLRKAAASQGRRVKALLQNMGDRLGPLVVGREPADAVRIINEEAARILEELGEPSGNGHP